MNNNNKFVLNAIGIKKGGGNAILNIFKKFDFDIIFIDDCGKKKKLLQYLSRLVKEIYFNLYLANCNFLYFSGLPPLFKKKRFVYCLFQNATIFYSNNDKNFINWIFSLNFLRYIYFKLFKSNVDKWLVLSKEAKKILTQRGINENLIKIINIFSSYLSRFRKIKIKKKYDFIYPASFLRHKNHLNLIKALIILSKDGINPKCLLVNDDKIQKFKYQDLICKYNLKVTIKCYSFNNMSYAYNSAKALIFPSLKETIGLPILEAAYLKIPIITANLPYAHEFVKSLKTFNPFCPIDIAQTIKKIHLSKTKTNSYLKISKIKNFNFNDLKKLSL
jgi:glycosyltransferase involved in cell wall biosynthesis